MPGARRPARRLWPWVFFCGGILAASTQAGENNDGITVALPVIAQRVEGMLRQWHIAVFCTFSPVHVDAHALAVDVVNLEMEGFMEPEAARINGGQIGFVLGSGDGIDNRLCFIYAQNCRKPLFPFCMDELKSMPVLS